MGNRAGSGDCQVLETPRPLVSAQKISQQMTKHNNIPIDRDTQERMRRKYDGGGKEVRDWRHDPHWERQVPGLRLSTEGGVGGVL